MGIQTTFQMNDDEETFVTQSTLDTIPHIGETIWFVPAGSRKSCKVVDVCHWISGEDGNNYHAACVYLEEI
jgi:hypothetical protein